MSSNPEANLTLAQVGSAVRRARTSQKLSQTELGHKAGLSRMPIYRIEAGQDISLRSLLSILSALRLGLQMPTLPQGVPHVQALQKAFAHLHAEDGE